MSNTIEINNRLTKLEVAMHVMMDRIKIVEKQFGKYASHGQLKTSEANTKNIINQNSILINNLEQKLLTISIPDDTKYFLNTTEIQDFRTNYKRLITMMADADRLYQSLISYTATIDKR